MEPETKPKIEVITSQTMITSLEIDVALHSEIKVYAAKNRLKIKDVVNNALKEYIEKRRDNDL